MLEELKSIQEEVRLECSERKKADFNYQEALDQVQKTTTELQRTISHNEAMQSSMKKCNSQCQDLQQHIKTLQNSETRLQEQVDAATAWIQHLQSSEPAVDNDSWKISPDEVKVFKDEKNIRGRGAWGYVCEGEFRGRVVAVKCAHKLIVSDSVIKRVKREIYTMSQLRHPNLVLFIAAVFEYDRPPMIVTELMEVNLREAYETKALENASMLPIFRDVACAPNYLHNHREPIIHRDVSAPNVLLQAIRDGWRAKISDFGSANRERSSRTLGEGAFVYSAPEMFPAAPGSPSVDHTVKIDVYSYGVLLCEVILKELPDDPRKVPDCVQRVQGQWPYMHKLITACVSWSHTDRPDMSKIIEDLTKIMPAQKSNR